MLKPMNWVEEKYAQAVEQRAELREVRPGAPVVTGTPLRYCGGCDGTFEPGTPCNCARCEDCGGALVNGQCPKPPMAGPGDGDPSHCFFGTGNANA